MISLRQKNIASFATHVAYNEILQMFAITSLIQKENGISKVPENLSASCDFFITYKCAFIKNMI
jgi:hypothetical protein